MGLGDVSRMAERNESEISLFNTQASTRGLARALITTEDDEIFIKPDEHARAFWAVSVGRYVCDSRACVDW